MKGRLMATLFLFLVFSASALHAQQFFLPQVANGQFPGGSIRVTFVLFNPTTGSVTVTLALTRDDGGPLEVTIPELGTDDEFTLTLAPGATRFLQTDGQGPLISGAATVTATAAIGVSAIFSIFDSAGRFLTEAGVGSSPPLTEFVIPVDTTGTFNTGVAFFNFGTSGVTLSIRRLDASGRELESITRSLGGKAHQAIFVAGGGQLFPAATNFRGTIVVSSTGPIAALVLRQNADPLSLTTLPVVSRTSTQREFNLPQAANGQFPGGSIRMSFLVFNISSSRATVNLSLTQDDGSPFRLTIPGLGTNSTFTINLEPGASAFLQTDGTGSLASGAAQVSSNVPIGVSAIFSIFDPQGRFLTEAGVGDSPPLREFTIPVDITGTFDTGVAFFVPGTAPVTLTIRLLDRNGALTQPPVTLTIAGKNHTARFASQFFAGIRDFRGSMSIAATGEVTSLVLRQNSDPLSFTTLPSARGAFAGGPPPPPPVAALLRETRTGVNATSDVTLNVTLPNGFRLSGTISGPRLVFPPVLARASDGTVFFGTLNRTQDRYLIIVPAGTYNLSVCFTPQIMVPVGLPVITFDDPAPVQVSSDTTRNITLPAVTTHTVSGTVSGLDRLPSVENAELAFSSADNKNGGIGLLEPGGSYQAQLPNGNYTVSLIVPQIPPAQQQTLSIFNLGTVNVSGANVTANFTIPTTVRLSGTVRTADMSAVPADSFVLATDTSAPPITTVSCAPPAFISTGSIDTSGGGYQMVLASGRTYGISAALPIIPLSVVAFPFPGRQVTLGADTVQNIDLPPLPGRVTISGRVTDSSGAGVAEVRVTALTQAVTGAPNATFFAHARTDANGNYRLTVLSGTDYRLDFTPLTPEP